MKARSRSALAPRAVRSPLRVAPVALAMLVGIGSLAGCQTPSAPASAAAVSAPPSDPRALAADLNARLDALQRQSEPASDDVISSLERTLRTQREKRARAIVAAGTTNVVESGAAPAVVAPPVAAPAPVMAAAASASVKSTKASRAAARAAAASAAVASRAAANANASLNAGASANVNASAAAASTTASLATAGPATRPAEIAVPPPAMVHSTAATVTGAVHTPMARTPESRLPVDELYDRARAMEVQLQMVQAVALYREASQRGHAPSSQRLMELYADGAPGVARDYRVAVFFKERAVQQGVSFDPVWRR